MMIDVDFFLGYKIFNMKCNWIQFLIYTLILQHLVSDFSFNKEG